MSLIKYRCPTCGATAEIDVDNKKTTIEYSGLTLPKPNRAMRIGMQAAQCFPSHGDCEFTKPVDEISLDALEQVDEDFVHVRIG